MCSLKGRSIELNCLSEGIESVYECWSVEAGGY
jgi:hypothetical protein